MISFPLLSYYLLKHAIQCNAHLILIDFQKKYFKKVQVCEHVSLEECYSQRESTQYILALQVLLGARLKSHDQYVSQRVYYYWKMWLTQYNTLPLLFYVHFAKSGYEFILCKLKATDKNSRLVIQSINVKLLNYKTKGFNNLWLCDMIHQMQQFSLINDIYACITKE